jgi:hypothetical protein
MAYKVLGQSISTAPSTAPVVVNMVKDPSFENLSNDGNAVAIANTSTVYPIPNTNGLWQAYCTTTAGAYPIAGASRNFTADNGNNCLQFIPYGNSNTSGTAVAVYGYNSGRTPSTITDQNSLDRTKAIKMIPGVVNYFGARFWTGSNVSSIGIIANIWDASGTYFSNTSQIITTPTTGSWQTVSTSFGNTSGGVYATLHLTFDFSGSWTRSTTSNVVAWDSVWASTSSTYTSTFPNPDNTTALTAPFNDRGIVYAGARGNSQSIRSYPGAMTDLYTVPAGSSAVVSTITVSNMNTRFATGAENPGYNTSTPVRIAILPSGQTLAKKNFIVFDAPVNSYTTQTFTIGQTLAAGDKIQVCADTADVSFTAFGSEN